MVSLRLADVGARYGRHTILSGITTPQFQGGEIVAVIGPNAAGKSTLFKRIAGLLAGPGEIAIDVAVRRSGVCYMPQDSTSTAVLSVYETIVLSRMQGRSLRVSDDDLLVIDAVVCDLGLDAIAGRVVGDLSGGQRQLVSIAQALAREPEILLMDEPTAALDLHRQIEVLSLVRRLARDRGMLILIALHDLNHALRFADQALVIGDGGLRGCGPVGDIVTPDLLTAVYGVDARIEACSRGHRHVIVDGVSGTASAAGK